MATIAKACLSGSTSGKNIKISQTSTPGTIIHTAGAVTGDDNYDEIYLWAVNSDSASIKLTIEYGGVASPDDDIEVTLTGETGLVLVLPGTVLQNALVVRGFAGSANLILVNGFVNKIRA